MSQQVQCHITQGKPVNGAVRISRKTINPNAEPGRGLYGEVAFTTTPGAAALTVERWAAENVRLGYAVSVERLA